MEEINIICKGCKCEVPKDYQLKTIGYCYLCDPKILLEELLSPNKITA